MFSGFCDSCYACSGKYLYVDIKENEHEYSKWLKSNLNKYKRKVHFQLLQDFFHNSIFSFRFILFRFNGSIFIVTRLTQLCKYCQEQNASPTIHIQTHILFVHGVSHSVAAFKLPYENGLLLMRALFFMKFTGQVNGSDANCTVDPILSPFRI